MHLACLEKKSMYGFKGKVTQFGIVWLGNWKDKGLL